MLLDKPPALFSGFRTSGFFLFSAVKTALKGRRFQDVEGIKKNVTAELSAVPFEAFSDCFQKLFERFNKCIQVGGDYFEQK
jgi:hypothetical protein